MFFVVQSLWGWYDKDRVLQRCLEQGLYDSAAVVAQLDGSFHTALQYRLTALKQRGCSEKQSMTDLATLTVQHYMRYCAHMSAVCIFVAAND